MLRYAITDRGAIAGTEVYRQKCLIQQVGGWAAAGIEFVQVREKELGAGELTDLVKGMVAAVRAASATGGSRTRVLVSRRADIAVAAGADGVHLTGAAGELTAEQVREVYRRAGLAEPVVSGSCHTVAEVERASEAGVDLVLFGPVFGKVVSGVEVVAGVGIGGLRAACKAAGRTRVLALGGVTDTNARECFEAGAVGAAGIRLFMEKLEK